MWQIVAILWSPEVDIGAQVGDYVLVTYENLAAAVIRSDVSNIGQLTPFERVDALFNYQTVLERAGINRNILPVRFGTIAKTKREISTILKEGAQRFRSLLSYAQGKAEYDLMGIWKEEVGDIEHNIFEALENKGYEFKVHEPVNQVICFHLSILMSPEEQETFSTIKEELGKRLGDRIDLRLSEPLPPHSFFTLDLHQTLGRTSREHVLNSTCT